MGKARQFVEDNFIAPSGKPDGDPLATKPTKKDDKPILSAESRQQIKHKFLICYRAYYGGVPKVHGHPHAFEQKHISNLAWNVAYAINADTSKVDRADVLDRCLKYIEWVFANIERIEKHIRSKTPGWRFGWNQLGQASLYQDVREWFVTGIPDPIKRDRVSDTQKRGGWEDDD